MHLVGLYTYCKMMHGAYNVKLMHVLITKEAVLPVLNYYASLHQSYKCRNNYANPNTGLRPTDNHMQFWVIYDLVLNVRVFHYFMINREENIRS